jgi:hypothetical protein
MLSRTFLLVSVLLMIPSPTSEVVVLRLRCAVDLILIDHHSTFSLFFFLLSSIYSLTTVQSRLGFFIFVYYVIIVSSLSFLLFDSHTWLGLLTSNRSRSSFAKFMIFDSHLQHFYHSHLQKKSVADDEGERGNRLTMQ